VLAVEFLLKTKVCFLSFARLRREPLLQETFLFGEEERRCQASSDPTLETKEEKSQRLKLSATTL
jgi:hypothetical protein